MTTFFLAAIDDRIKASAPVSGTLSTTGWVRQRLSVAHCDCQYPVNSYGLLYSEIGAMVAPRPQLLVNADADPDFPMDAFKEMADKVGGDLSRLQPQRRVVDRRHAWRAQRYRSHQAAGLFVLPQGVSRQERPGDDEGPVEEPSPDELICFRNGLPIDERLTRIDEELIPIGRRD